MYVDLVYMYVTHYGKSISTLTLKVLNFWKSTSYFSLKPLWSGMGEVVHQLSRLAL